MTKIPEDVMKAARDASLLCIGGMCSTYRHDYGLLPENERKTLYVTMSQLAYHDVAPVIARAIMAERHRCATIASRYADGYEAGLPCYGAADKDSGRGRQEGHIKAGRDIAEAISAGKDEKRPRKNTPAG